MGFHLFISKKRISAISQYFKHKMLIYSDLKVIKIVNFLKFNSSPFITNTSPQTIVHSYNQFKIKEESSK